MMTRKQYMAAFMALDHVALDENNSIEKVEKEIEKFMQLDWDEVEKKQGVRCIRMSMESRDPHHMKTRQGA